MSRIMQLLRNPASAPNQSMVVVVGADGKPRTILQSPDGAVGRNKEECNPFQYSMPISKYNTLHSVAAKRKPRKTHSARETSAKEVHLFTRRSSQEMSNESHVTDLFAVSDDVINLPPQRPTDQQDNRPLVAECNADLSTNNSQQINCLPLPEPNGAGAEEEALGEVQDDHQMAKETHPLVNNRLEKEYNALKSKEQEEQVELRRLRTENRLLIQRVDNLEKETATLADRLIQDQVRYAQQEEQVYALRRDVCRNKASQNNEHLNRTHSAPENADDTTSSPPPSCVDLTSTLDSAKDEQIELLQQELADIRRKESDAVATVTQMQHKIRELENVNSQLQTEPTSQVQCLQEELIASKLREAECNLALKELQNKVIELDKHFQKYVEHAKQSPPSGKAGKQKMEQMQEDLMSLRIREAASLAEVKDMKQTMMELETQKHILERQLKRMEGETEKMQGQLEEAIQHDKDLKQSLKEREREVSDHQSKRKEDTMMSRIKDAEHSQAVAEMRRRIAELEIENQELVTSGQLQDKGDRQELENRIVDLQEEILQLKMTRHIPNMSSVAMNNVDTESDYDTEDMEATLNNSRLTLTDSMIGDSIATLAPPRRPQIADLHLYSDSSERDDDEEEEETMGSIKIKMTRRKKRSSQRLCRGSVDSDKTPTQDTSGEGFLLDYPLQTGHGASSVCNGGSSVARTGDGQTAVETGGVNGNTSPIVNHNAPVSS